MTTGLLIISGNEETFLQSGRNYRQKNIILNCLQTHFHYAKYDYVLEFYTLKL